MKGESKMRSGDRVRMVDAFGSFHYGTIFQTIDCYPRSFAVQVKWDGMGNCPWCYEWVDRRGLELVVRGE